jgi:hypothetical protein
MGMLGQGAPRPPPAPPVAAAATTTASPAKPKVQVPKDSTPKVKQGKKGGRAAEKHAKVESPKKHVAGPYAGATFQNSPDPRELPMPPIFHSPTQRTRSLSGAVRGTAGAGGAPSNLARELKGLLPVPPSADSLALPPGSA